MTKSYLKYVPSSPFGVISSSNANLVYDHSGTLAICPAHEDVVVWHLRQGTQISRWHDTDNFAEVSIIARSPHPSPTSELFAVGYNDGSIRLWNLKNNECTITLNGHKSAVTALAFDEQGTRLISGGKDTDIVVWDVLGEIGLYRLQGHKDVVTWISFLFVDGEQKYVISASKDTLVKVWDLSTQHSIETVIGHRSEIWSCILVKDESILITGSSDSDIKVFSIDKQFLKSKMEPVNVKDDSNGDQVAEPENNSQSIVNLLGNLSRNSKERVAQLQLDSKGRYFACQTADKTFEIFQVNSDEDLKKKIQRKAKRSLEKDDSKVAPPAIVDQFVSVRVVKANAKLKSFDFKPAVKSVKQDGLVVLFGLVDNSVEVNSIQIDDAEISNQCTLDIHGHKSEIRSMSLSSDDQLLASLGTDTLKIWNLETKTCIRTLSVESSTGICCSFLPGNRHVIVGTKTGTLEVFDSWSSTCIETIQAHSGTIWSIDIRPDKRGLVTGSADKEIKFWDFSAIEDEEYSKTTRKLTLTHMRTLQMPDEVLCVKFSPNQNLIAIALLDSTVKIFYHDTLKFFLSLYGHKLPVLSMDISHDNNLLVTGSADKNIKLWGLDFGDCHKSIRAHEDSITQVKFVPQTHYVFSGSKDRVVKYWDGDSFDLIMKMSGHHAEVKALCVGKWGNTIVSAGSDKSIRVWDKTDEQLFLDEEREREIEDMYEKEMIDSSNANEDGEATKKTSESIKAAEKLLDAIAIYEDMQEKMTVYEKCRSNREKLNPPDLPPLLVALGNISPEIYTFRVLEKIRSIQLEQSLWILPLGKAISLLKMVDYWLTREWNVALCSRIAIFLVKIHFKQLCATTNSTLKNVVESLRDHLRGALETQKDTISFNLAGSRVLRKLWEAEHTAEFIDWEKELAGRVSKIKAGDASSNAKKRKRKQVVVKQTLKSQ